MSTRRIRVDSALVQRGLAESVDVARALIDEGVVLANGSVVMTHSRQVAPSDELLVKLVDQFVSRGGIKLEAALAAFGIDVNNQRALDGDRHEQSELCAVVEILPPPDRAKVPQASRSGLLHAVLGPVSSAAPRLQSAM